jgi:carbamoyltransferase
VKTPVNVLGVSDTHNASAALISDRVGLVALQEERPTREKNHSGFPYKSIEFVLQHNGLQPSDVDVVALAGVHQPPDRDRQGILAEFERTATHASRLKGSLRRTPVFALHREVRRRERLSKVLGMGFRSEAIRFVDHHTCHAASAYFGRREFADPVLVITCDGAGDGLCSTVSLGAEGKLHRRFAVPWSESFGILYAHVTFLQGMVPLEHEYKMMGMAPYAKGGPATQVADRLSALFEWAGDGSPVWHRRNGVRHMYYVQPTLDEIFRRERFDSIMAGTQLFTERMLCELVRRAVRATGVRRVAVSGGVFMNVKANKEILALDEVDELFVFPSCGDETNAIGACYLEYASSRSVDNLPSIGAFFLGPSWSGAEVDAACTRAVALGMTVTRTTGIEHEIAKLLAQGEVVARFWGREEFGARSLGNRAILANPVRRGVIQEINEAVKNRDFWMPFAASVLDESAPLYFVNPKRAASPYMILSFDTTQKGQDDLVNGIHPYDKTCRPQIVSREANPDYWKLIDEFRQLTGIGGVVNTSLNLHGDPLVHTPLDAIAVLERSELRHLALNEFLVQKADPDR